MSYETIDAAYRTREYAPQFWAVNRGLIADQQALRIQFQPMADDDSAMVELTANPRLSIYRSEDDGTLKCIDIDVELLRELLAKAAQASPAALSPLVELRG